MPLSLGNWHRAIQRTPCDARGFWKGSNSRSGCKYASLRHCNVLSSISGQLDCLPSEIEPKPPTGSKTVKRKVAMWIGYVGSEYKGLQIQRNLTIGQTIEEELEKAIFKAGGMLESNFGNLEKIRWMRSSRTDKGVHSLSTVISFKLEVEQGTLGGHMDGIAERINGHLPKSIRVFGIVPVNKSFDPRRDCCSRTYHYLLPARAIGITDDSHTEEKQECILKFQRVLSSFEGRYAFHNYTVRAHYRKKARNLDGNVERKGNFIEKEETLTTLEDDIDSSDDESLLENSASDFKNIEYGSNEDKSHIIEEVECAAPSLPKVRWLHERDFADKISSAHFRKILTFSCGGLDAYQGLQYLNLTIHGESFMLHQIRKMVGTAVAIMRDVLPADIIPISLTVPCRVVLPLAPSEGLFLASNEFFPFRSNFNKPKYTKHFNDLPRLRTPDNVVKRKEEFWSKVLLPEMVLVLKDSNSMWNEWLERLELGRIPEGELNIVRAAWSDWTEQISLKCRTAEEREMTDNQRK